MDRDAILKAAQAAVTWTQEVGGRTFVLRVPSQHQVRVAYMRLPAKDKDGGDPIVVMDLISQSLLERAIIGWSGVAENDLIANDVDKAVEFHADLVPVLLDAQYEISSELRSEMSKRMMERTTAFEAAKKNSPIPSTGPAPVKQKKRAS